jgi:regulation of enolase protein 1 (concanavalin A-like superfamily)
MQTLYENTLKSHKCSNNNCFKDMVSYKLHTKCFESVVSKGFVDYAMIEWEFNNEKISYR